MTSKLLLAATAIAAISLPAQAATLVNGGFEAGLSGWTFTTGDYEDIVNGPLVEAIGSASDANANLYVDEGAPGSLFAHLTAGADPLNLSAYTLLSQTFDVGEGAVLSLRAAFLGADYDDYDDDAFVRLTRLSDGLTTVLFQSRLSEVLSFGSTPWTDVSTDPLAGGRYRLEAGVRDAAPDGSYYPGFHSRLLLDQVAVTGGGPVAAVPEPQAWALMIAGFGAVGACLRRRRMRALHL